MPVFLEGVLQHQVAKVDVFVGATFADELSGKEVAVTDDQPRNTANDDFIDYGQNEKAPWKYLILFISDG